MQFPKWLFYGVGHDPHLRSWLPGMVRVVGPDSEWAAIVAACVPPPEVKPFEVRITLLPDSNATAFAWREPWKTQLSPEPVPALFITTEKFETPADALAAARRAFPQVWARFEKLTIGETCTYSPLSSVLSASTTPEPAPASAPEKPSAKSSA